MPVCGDSAYEMVSVFGIGDIKKNVVAEAQISSINRANNTADLVYISTCSPALPSTDIEFYYHCETSTGTLEDLAKGHKAFAEGETVYVVHLPAIGEEVARTYIVGHVDIRSTRKCILEYLEVRQGDYVTLVDVASKSVFDLISFAGVVGGPAKPASFPCLYAGVYFAWRSYYFETATSGVTIWPSTATQFIGALTMFPDTESPYTTASSGGWDVPVANQNAAYWASFHPDPGLFYYDATASVKNDRYTDNYSTPRVISEDFIETSDRHFMERNYILSTGYDLYEGTDSFFKSYSSIMTAEKFCGLYILDGSGMDYVGVKLEITGAGEVNDPVNELSSASYTVTLEYSASIKITRVGLFTNDIAFDQTFSISASADADGPYDPNPAITLTGEAHYLGGLSGSSGYYYAIGGVYTDYCALALLNSWSWGNDNCAVGRFGYYFLHGVVFTNNTLDLSIVDTDAVGFGGADVQMSITYAEGDAKIVPGVLIIPVVGSGLFSSMSGIDFASPVYLRDCLPFADRTLSTAIADAVVDLTQEVFTADGMVGARATPSLDVFLLKNEYA